MSIWLAAFGSMRRKAGGADNAPAEVPRGGIAYGCGPPAPRPWTNDLGDLPGEPEDVGEPNGEAALFGLPVLGISEREGRKMPCKRVDGGAAAVFPAAPPVVLLLLLAPADGAPSGSPPPGTGCCCVPLPKPNPPAESIVGGGTGGPPTGNTGGCGGRTVAVGRAIAACAGDATAIAPGGRLFSCCGNGNDGASGKPGMPKPPSCGIAIVVMVTGIPEVTGMPNKPAAAEAD
jgi:hypothetical protein